jgi:hypothetical protein
VKAIERRDAHRERLGFLSVAPDPRETRAATLRRARRSTRRPRRGDPAREEKECQLTPRRIGRSPRGAMTARPGPARAAIGLAGVSVCEAAARSEAERAPGCPCRASAGDRRAAVFKNLPPPRAAGDRRAADALPRRGSLRERSCAMRDAFLS